MSQPSGGRQLCSRCLGSGSRRAHFSPSVPPRVTLLSSTKIVLDQTLTAEELRQTYLDVSKLCGPCQFRESVSFIRTMCAHIVNDVHVEKMNGKYSGSWWALFSISL